MALALDFNFPSRVKLEIWLECLPAGSITTRLGTYYSVPLLNFFPPGRRQNCRNDILDVPTTSRRSLSEAWTRFKDLLQKIPHHGIDLWLQERPNDFTKSVKQIILPPYVPSTSEARLAFIERRNSEGSIIGGLILWGERHKEDEAKEEDGEKSTVTDYKGHEITDEMEDKVESKEEVEEETEEEAEEEEEEGNQEHFNTFPTMNELRLEPRRKLSNPKKNCNFVGRVRGLKVFFGNFTYECDFMVLEDTTSVIDHYLRSVVSGKPFVEAIRLVYNKEEGTIVFERDNEKIVFKMPYKMDMFKHIDFAYISTDCIPPFVIKSDNDNCEKTHYLDSLDLGPEYKYDEYVCRGIQSFMATKSIGKNKG
ncbi:hypothetical protein Tco_0937016 [Tanacetum coccineum]|uniref:Uncharacterized protein n=1 Tax=Tanacetum coccineum TaxID=301880 RepID=A0ABQ5DD19_9ASTR